MKRTVKISASILLTLILTISAVMGFTAFAETDYYGYEKVGGSSSASQYQYSDNMPSSYTGILKSEYYQINSENDGTVTILDLDEPFTCKIVDTEFGYDGVYDVDSIHVGGTEVSARIGSRVTVSGSIMTAHTGHHRRDFVMIDAKIVSGGSSRSNASSETASSGGSYVRATGELNIRSSASLNGTILGTIVEGATLSYAGSTSTDSRGVVWYKVYYGSRTGWVSSMYSELDGYSDYTDYHYDSGSGRSGSYVVATGELNIRSSASLNGTILGTIVEGASLSYAGSTSTDSRGVVWYKVYYGSRTGWVSSMYSELDGYSDYHYDSGSSRSGSYVVATGELNIRSSASLNGTILGTIVEGASLSYAGSASTDSRGVVWYKVYYGSKTGWVSSMYSDLVR